ncbi:FeoB small GTPase domain-containing protein [[Bacillus] enclensis]|uniref:FeoB small GTPase domain-containing protein n=1 Tax=[Bacillus] enclensis TaxID=1402860 RepID=UPI0018DDDECA|nr:FeoB small GTPase domain-containing protein [[Bacillus] enclensis]MBH9965215.1 50S ribosome-binding GTPase [[Bacillus] enclensis]
MNGKKYRIALAGNPNTGKSTLFNQLTGLRQHTGNWPGKTVAQSKGYFEHKNEEFEIIDLPGTYSLIANSMDEEIARNYIAFEQPDVTVVVLDATSLERNLNIALQVLEITDKAVICLNLIDEAAKKGIEISEAKLQKKLGVPVVKISARNKVGISSLLDAVLSVVKGLLPLSPYKLEYSAEIEERIEALIPDIQSIYGSHLPARWIALRLLEGDERIIDELNVKLLNEKKGGQSYEFASGEY